jgi:uncharacterized lipoprotein YddW (UPF0748 family)
MNRAWWRAAAPTSVRAPSACLAALVLAAACGTVPQPEPETLAPEVVTPPVVLPAPPDAPREFRGVWVATVSNMDWPSRRNLSTAQQQAELIAILDRAVELGLNAIIFQVRPGADALYPSALEPWSEYLTGAMGRAPQPFWDPLEFAVREAHRRGLELHAWFNPYRARHPSARSQPATNHISRTRPDLTRVYGGHLWMDPGEPEVQQRTIDVIVDVVRRYDVDGIHIDDYFYPYRERDARNRPIPFPDDASWQRYRRSGGSLSRDDWRRRNVDVLVERIYGEVKREKPWVKFGISPFGIWRPGHPPQIRGLDAYQEIYADARKWLNEGWLDYFTPQLYWPIAQTPQSFPVLLDWWAGENHHDRHLWPGGFTSRVTGAERGWPAGEILSQIEVVRGEPRSTGYVHFSMRSLLMDPDSLTTRLQRDSYAARALVPATPWLGGQAPAAPRVAATENYGGSVSVELEPGDTVAVRHWIVRSRRAGAWRLDILPGGLREYLLPEADADHVAVSAVDRTGLEGALTLVRVGPAGRPVGAP